MCWPSREMPTNQLGAATRLWLCHCQSIQIRVFHVTWIAFWLCFFGWFATANLGPQITEDLGLTDVDKAIAGGCSVASTVIFRVIIGWLCDKIGAKKSYVGLLIISAFPVCGMALVQSSEGYIIVSLLIGIAGASFVITQYHCTVMFAGKTVGTANATSAGWGNFGGGCANFIMPLLYNHFVSAYGATNSEAWRYCMLVPGLCYIVYAFIYWFFTVDRPPLPETHQNEDNNENNENNKNNTQNKEKEMEEVQVQNNINELPERESKKASGGFKVGATDYRTWILFCVYAGCFGIELTVLRFAAAFFVYEFNVDQELAGFIILCFSFCNLFARSIGGIIADVVSRYAKKSLNGRVMSLFIVLLYESVFLILFSIGEFTNSFGYTIFMLIMFSLGVQAAEGITFAIVPFIQPKAIGPVSGIVGAGGNMGAMLFAFCIFTQVPTTIQYWQAWLVLGIFVFVVSFMTLCIKFTDDEIRSADAKMNTWVEMERDAELEGNNDDKEPNYSKVDTTEVEEHHEENEQ